MSEREPRRAKKPPQKCGTCKWLRPRTDGKPFWHGGSYKCMWVMPSDFKWPDSMSERDFGSPLARLKEGPGSYMKPGEGVECPRWKPATNAGSTKAPDRQLDSGPARTSSPSSGEHINLQSPHQSRRGKV